jgi:hypothetical protein
MLYNSKYDSKIVIVKHGSQPVYNNFSSRIQVSVMKEYGPNVNGQLAIEKYERS